jgi:GT2 family glycosyltransferase
VNITLFLAVYNQLNLTKECYSRLRNLYPFVKLVISSGGSNDGTKEWLESLNDVNLSYTHNNNKLTFSDNYNTGIKLVKTEKLILIHNDMVIGKGFLESIERLLEPDMVLSYTTIEPSIFTGHKRPGKVILDCGLSFEDFNDSEFDNYVEECKENDTLHDGAVFFMSGYKKMFDSVGGFDGFSFNPYFCEDDDFLIRAKLKGYRLKTCDSAIVYHFVSKTSRFSDDNKKNCIKYEENSNKNFIRKWGVGINSFIQLKYWENDNFTYNKFTMGYNGKNIDMVKYIEPFFDKIDVGFIPIHYIENEQENTNYDIKNKFTSTDDMDVIVTEMNSIDNKDFMVISNLRFLINNFKVGEYQSGNLKITIKKDINSIAFQSH